MAELEQRYQELELQVRRHPGGPVGSIEPLALTIYIDPEKDVLTLWFRGTCAACRDSYDSDYGNNYHFSTRKFTGY